MITVCDPTNWMQEHKFQVSGRVVQNQSDALLYDDPRILINRYVDTFDYDPDNYDLTIWTGLENLSVHLKRNYLQSGHHVVVSESWTPDLEMICHPGFLYPLASMVGKSYVRPNYQAQYLADVLIGRIDHEVKINRAWCYYEIKRRLLVNSVIMPVRVTPKFQFESIPDNEIKNYLLDAGQILGPITPSYDQQVDRLENAIVLQDFRQGLDPHDVFGSVFEHSADKNIPWGIYHQSAYSLIMPDYNIPMICEKVSKALIMGRPFIAIGPQGYLANLQKLGFQTFDPVIDESYDSEPNHLVRWNRAMDALEDLSQKSVQSVYDRLKKRLKHNRKMSYNNEYWINRLKFWLNCKIEKYTGIKCAIF